MSTKNVAVSWTGFRIMSCSRRRIVHMYSRIEFNRHKISPLLISFGKQNVIHGSSESQGKNPRQISSFSLSSPSCLFKPSPLALLVFASTRGVSTYQINNGVEEGGCRRRRGGDSGGTGEGAVLGPTAGAATRHERANKVVALPRPDRRVHGDAHLPLRQHRHRDRVQEPVNDGQRLHGRRLPRRGVVVRRNDLHPRLLHRRRLRRPHQPGGDHRPLLREEAVACPYGALRRRAVPRRHLRRGDCQGDHEASVQFPRRRREFRCRWVLRCRRARGGDRRHVYSCLHRLLRYRPQAHRPRLLYTRAGAASDRVRGVRGASGDDTDHRNGDKSGEEPRRSRAVQPAESLARPLDLLGGAGDRGVLSGGVSQTGAAWGGGQGA